MSQAPLHLFHIAYNAQTAQNVPPGLQLLDNVDSTKNDWREYWPIRNYLLTQQLDDDAWYGFLSPRFAEKVGLGYAQVRSFIDGHPDADVYTFSPQPDMGAFFLNVFEQEELFQPGFAAAADAFFAAIGRPLRVLDTLMDSRHVVFSNYFVAKPSFWRAWLALTEPLFAICEGPDSPVRQGLLHETTYPGAVQRKVFLMERLVSVLLVLEPQWRVRAWNTFACAWLASRLNQFKVEAVLSDALKIAMREQGFADYRSAFALLRDRLRQPDAKPMA